MPNLLYKCLTKATTAEGDQRRLGTSWVTARRAFLKVFDDHLECGDWRIPYTDITDAVLFSFPSVVLRVPGHILTVVTPQRTYHFGLNGWGKFWKGDLPFPARRESGRLGFTWPSILGRAILIGYIAYRVWRRW